MKKILLSCAMGVTLISAVGFVACSGETEYSVVCETCENGYVFVADTKAEAGEKVILAAKPSAGYQLTSFLLDGEVLDGCSFVMPEKDVTVSATFEVITYSITYVWGDVAPVEGNPETYTVENAAELISPEKEGYEICGWYTYYADPQYEWEAEENAEAHRVTSLEGLYGNLTLYAQYHNPPHEIIVADTEKGVCYVEDYKWEACYGETVNVVAEPYSGYELDYIAVNGNPIEGASFTMPKEDIEITVEFKPIRYSITYDLDDGVNAPDNPDFYTVEDDEIVFGDAQKEGYIFEGWYYDDGYGMLFLYDSTFTVYTPCYPITLYASFIPEDEETE